jgi:hypothetical protein
MGNLENIYYYLRSKVMAKLQRKRFLAFFLTVLMMVGIFAEMPIHMTVSAATQYVDGNVWSYEEEDGIITITGIEEAGDPSNIIIPAEINGGNVGKIGDYAFSSIYDLTSVTIPAGVTDIGNYAFAYCSNLTSVELPESLTMIGSSAFYDSGLTSITIPDSVTTIESSAFYSCNGLTSVELPESLTAIGSSAFSNCTGLTSITIPASVKTIGSSAFQSTGLTSITIPDSVTAIESSAFYNCSALTSAYFEHGNASEITFGSSVFGSTASGFRIIYDDAAEGFNPNSDGTWNSYPAVSESFAASLNGFAVEGTESYTITGYTGELTEIEIPSAIGEIPVTAIGNSAFSGKSNLTSIIIPDSVTTIGDSAFYNCTGLTSVELPENLTTIGSSVFYGCSGLTSVTIPDSVTTIGVNAFNNCTGLTSVTIPNSVTTIGDSAFYYCTALKIASFEHTDASKITSFGYNVFYRAASGFRIEYPDGDDVTGYETDGEKYTWKGFPAYPSSVSAELEKLAGFTYTIDNDGFVINGYNGTETEVEIPPNIGDIKVYRIAQNAFNTYSNGNITSVTIPDTIINIGQEAFFNCNRLTRAYFKHADGNNVRLGQSVFPNTTDFQIIYPEGAVNFADNDYKWNGYTAYPQGFVMPESDFEFQYENGGVTITGYKGEATEIEIPSEIDERPILAIGDRVFSEKYNLKSITIPDSVKTIGNYAFYYCYGLTSIEISENLTAIGEYAFYNCSNLKSVELPESLTTIGNDAFQSCSGLTSITIPANVTAIGDSAFYYC